LHELHAERQAFNGAPGQDLLRIAFRARLMTAAMTGLAGIDAGRPCRFIVFKFGIKQKTCLATAFQTLRAELVQGGPRKSADLLVRRAAGCCQRQEAPRRAAPAGAPDGLAGAERAHLGAGLSGRPPGSSLGGRPPGADRGAGRAGRFWAARRETTRDVGRDSGRVAANTSENRPVRAETNAGQRYENSLPKKPLFL